MVFTQFSNSIIHYVHHLNTSSTNIPIQIKKETKFKEISAGEDYSLAIDSEGYLWSWGGNQYGQLGNGTTKDTYTPIKLKEDMKFKEIEGSCTCFFAIDEEGDLWIWGANIGGFSNFQSSTVPRKVFE